MKWFIDTEFYEQGASGRGSIDLISIGMVNSAGQEYYAENAAFSWDDVPANHWLHDNVRPHMIGADASRHPGQIRQDIFALAGTKPEFWGWYCDYDWVIFCWLFGRMVDLPPHFPKFCRDLRQVCKDKHIDTSTLPKQAGTEHNALEDARWNRLVWKAIK